MDCMDLHADVSLLGTYCMLVLQQPSSNLECFSPGSLREYFFPFRKGLNGT